MTEWDDARNDGYFEHGGTTQDYALHGTQAQYEAFSSGQRQRQADDARHAINSSGGSNSSSGSGAGEGLGYLLLIVVVGIAALVINYPDECVLGISSGIVAAGIYKGASDFKWNGTSKWVVVALIYLGAVVGGASLASHSHNEGDLWHFFWGSRYEILIGIGALLASYVFARDKILGRLSGATALKCTLSAVLVFPALAGFWEQLPKKDPVRPSVTSAAWFPTTADWSHETTTRAYIIANDSRLWLWPEGTVGSIVPCGSEVKVVFGHANDAWTPVITTDAKKQNGYVHSMYLSPMAPTALQCTPK